MKQQAKFGSQGQPAYLNMPLQMPKVQTIIPQLYYSRFSEPQQQSLQAKVVCKKIERDIGVNVAENINEESSVLASVIISNTWNQEKRAQSYSNLKGISNNLNAASRRFRESSPTKSQFSSTSGGLATFESSQLRIMIQDKYMTVNNNRGSQVLQSIQLQQQARPNTGKGQFNDKLYQDAIQQVKTTSHKQNKSSFEKHSSKQRSRQTSQTRVQIQGFLTRQPQLSMGEGSSKSKENHLIEKSREKVFTPPKSQTQSRKKSKKKSQKTTQENKENINALSNQKPQNDPNKGGKLLISKSVIDKLKQEVQRQVSKQIQSRETLSPKPKQKHLTSVIPFDAKIKLRKQKQEAQKQAEEAILKQRRDMELQRSERKKKRLQVEQERNEKIQNLMFIKKSLSRSPARKTYESDLVEIHPTIEQVDSETHRSSNSGGTRRQVYSTTSDRNLQVLSQSMKPTSMISIHMPTTDSKTENSVSSNQNNQWNNYLKNLKHVYNFKENKRSIEESEHQRKEKVSQLVQGQIQKKRLELKQKQQEEALRVINLQRQLMGLNKEYKKGLDQFKLRQRAKTEQRIESKKKQKKRKNLKKKIKSKTFLRSSAPQFVSSPSNGFRSALNDFQKHQLTSPGNQQILVSSASRMRSALNPLTLDSQSPLSHYNKSCTEVNFNNNDQLGVRGSSQSVQTFNNFQYNSDGEEAEMRKQMKKAKSNKQILMRNYNQQFVSTTQPKRCTLFQNKSTKNLSKNQEGIMTVPITELRNEQMFEEFAKMRRELEKVLKDQKLKHTEKKKSAKKKIKNQNMPFKPSQNIELSSQRSNQQKLQKHHFQSQQKEKEKIQIAKQKILEKLQEVTDRVQHHYLMRQSSNQQQQTLMISGNIIKEEESRDIEMTGIAHQTTSQQNKSIILENDQMSQIKKYDEESIEPAQNRHENTTFLLNKMYQDDPILAQKEIQASIVIQKFYRGYCCRRIIRQKLKIDQEFRLLRQKYEAKNSSSFVNSLAFSQSVNPYKTSKDLTKSRPKKSSERLQNEFEELVSSQGPNQPPQSDNSQLTFSENKFYKQGDEGNEQLVSVFSSPSIQQVTQEVIEEEAKGTLFDTELVLQNKLKLLSSNFSKSGELPPMGTPKIFNKQLIAQQAEQIGNREEPKELKSKRSSVPLDDRTPFQEFNEDQIQHPFPNNSGIGDSYEMKKEQAIQDFEDIDVKDYHKGYLDSPMNVQDLEDNSDEPQIQLNHNLEEPKQSNKIVILDQCEEHQKPNALHSKFIYKSDQDVGQAQEQNFEQNILQGFKRLGMKSNSFAATYKIDQQESTSHMIIEENGEQSGDPVEQDKMKKMLHRNEDAQSFSSSKNNQNSLFEKNTFQVFTQEKIQQMKKAELELQNMVEDLKIALYHKVKQKQRELNEGNLSVRSYNRRKMELEKWVMKEKKDIQKTKKHFIQGCEKMNSLIEQISKDQDRMKDVMGMAKTDPQKSRKSLSFDADFMKLIGDNCTDQENSISGCDNSGSQRSPSNISLSPRETIEELKIDDSQPKKAPFPYRPDIFEPRAGSSDNSKQTKKDNDLSQPDESIESLEFSQNPKVPPKAPVSNKFEIGMIKPREEVKIDFFEATKQKQQQNKTPPLLQILEVKKINEGDSEKNAFNFPIAKINDSYEISKLDSFDLSSEKRLDRGAIDDFVNEIFQNVIMKELSENLFPQRALTKVAQQKANEKFVEALTIGNLIKISENQSEGSPFMSERSPENDQGDQDKKKQGIPTDIVQVNTYMQEIFQRIKTDHDQLASVLENVSAPLYKDPLMILSHLQNSAPEPTLDEDGEQEQAPYQQSVLSVDLYLDIEKERRGGLSISQMKDSFQESNSKSFVAEMENIHNKAIFDAVNEALDGFRPYGLKGPPLPWSKQNKTLTFKYGREETFDFLIEKVKFKLLEWAHMNAGILSRPNMTLKEKEQMEMLREERLARILIQEADENEALWIDYEYEETQTKLDLADLILEKLCGETAEILNSLKLKQNQ